MANKPHLIPLKTLSVLRMIVGTSCVLVPRQAGALFGAPLAPGVESVQFGRMLGIRDFVLGAYLWRRIGDVEKSTVGMIAGRSHEGVRTGLLSKTNNPALENGSATNAHIASMVDNNLAAEQDQARTIENLRSALWLGLICDLVDLVSVGVCWLEGTPLSGLAEISIGGGAALFVAVGGQALWAGRRA